MIFILREMLGERRNLRLWDGDGDSEAETFDTNQSAKTVENMSAGAIATSSPFLDPVAQTRTLPSLYIHNEIYHSAVASWTQASLIAEQ